MSKQSWRTSFASVIGTSHQKQDAVCQDAGLCQLLITEEGAEVLFAVVSDGAGSAPKSDIGSKITVDLFMREFGKAITAGVCLTNIDKSYVLQWLELVRGEIATQAEKAGLSSKDYACTVLGAIVGQKNAVFFQIGDGAIVVSPKDSQEYSPMFWPQHGEFANQTNFIIQDSFADTLEFANRPEQFDKIALFTDGIERLILDFSSKTAHPPALSPIFDWLATTDPSLDDAYCPALVAYLASDFINSRTDDDKTLVIATRSSPAP